MYAFLVCNIIIETTPVENHVKILPLYIMKIHNRYLQLLRSAYGISEVEKHF